MAKGQAMPDVVPDKGIEMPAGSIRLQNWTKMSGVFCFKKTFQKVAFEKNWATTGNRLVNT
jgi:hypothetical protein